MVAQIDVPAFGHGCFATPYSEGGLVTKEQWFSLDAL